MCTKVNELFVKSDGTEGYTLTCVSSNAGKKQMISVCFADRPHFPFFVY